MFSKNNRSNFGGGFVSRNSVPSIISADLRILGNLISEGAIEVEGSIEGNVTCQFVTIHKSGIVHGDIFAESVHINGEVRGLVKARNVRLSEHGKVIGVIMYETLSIEDGGYVDGQCKNTDKLHRNELEMASTTEAEDTDTTADIRLISSREREKEVV